MLILKPLSIDQSVAGAKIPAVTFIAQAGLPARELAHMLDSLVRVSRRVEENHFVSIVAPEYKTLTREYLSTPEYNQRHSPTRRRADIPLDFSPDVNRC